MPVTLKTGVMKYRKSDGTYSVMDALMPEQTQEQIAAIESAGQEQVDAIEQTGQDILDNLPEDYTEIEADVSGLKNALDDVEDLTLNVSQTWDAISLTLEKGYYNRDTGVFSSDTSRRSAKISVDVGDKYRLSTFIKTAIISGLLYIDSSDAVVAHYLDGTGTGQTITDYEFTIPAGVSKIIVQSATYNNGPTLSKFTETKSFVGYTKAEVDEKITTKKYGIRYEISNNDDLGERCFDAVGKNAVVGIGSTNGQSDFDAIYPWSEMKRCNINKNENGAEVVTFEGETGFALDGTNGDVFVRIPKFYYERYRKNGYEYRVVSSTGVNVHPAFIEDGKELDEIFIGAFEGFKDNYGKLHSISGVIPTSNITAQEFLTAAQANGENYSIYDNRCVDAIWTLMAIEYGKRNTNAIIGYGLADFEQPVNSGRCKIVASATATNTIRTNKWNEAAKGYIPVGSNITVCGTDQSDILTQAKLLSCVDSGDYTDWTFDGDPIDVDENCFFGSAAFNTNWCESVPNNALSWHTGRANWISNSVTRNPIRYRWIENVVGNLWHFLPDITFHNLQMYQCKNMKDYVMHKFTSPYYPTSKVFPVQQSNGDKSDSTGSNFWVTELDENVFAKGISFGRSYDTSLTSEKAFGAYYYLYNSDVVICNGGGFDHLWRCNMLTQRAWQGPTSKWYLYGARMIYKHLN